jgi:hypothetical protein
LAATHPSVIPPTAQRQFETAPVTAVLNRAGIDAGSGPKVWLDVKRI